MGQLDKRRRYGKVHATPIVVMDWFKFTAIETCTFTLNIHSGVPTTTLQSISYSTNNGVSWVTTNNKDNETVVITTPNIQAGACVLWKGNGVGMSYSASGKNSIFTSTGRFEVSGNIMSLLYGDDFEDKLQIPSSNCFARLFLLATKLTKASSLSIPATTLTSYCYTSMFLGCKLLTEAPTLPATSLQNFCYNSMFYGCSSLTVAPTLPAKVMLLSCYGSMFRNCTSLKAMPTLPATTLNTACYASMFEGCTSLVTVTSLPAQNLYQQCYQSMFYGCTSLTSAPVLPATSLQINCYYTMFYRCSKLSYIKAMFTSTPGMSNTNYTTNWVYGVKATGTFVKNRAATWNVTGANGIPAGWTVQTASS